KGGGVISNEKGGAPREPERRKGRRSVAGAGSAIARGRREAIALGSWWTAGAPPPTKSGKPFSSERSRSTRSCVVLLYGGCAAIRSICQVSLPRKRGAAAARTPSRWRALSASAAAVADAVGGAWSAR